MRLLTLPFCVLAASLASAFETVVIDPGHGGIDEGTAWYRVQEKDATLAVAKRLEKILREKGIRAILTRSTDTYVSLNQRAEIADRQPQSLLLSIHFNGSRSTNNNGFATYYFSQSPSGKFVAQTIQDALDEALSTRNHGARTQEFALLVRTAYCAVLVECGFISNKEEAMRIASPEGQQWLAEALALGIIRAKPVVIHDPPEVGIAKCEAYAKQHEEKERKRAASAALNKRPAQPPPAPAKKK